MRFLNAINGPRSVELLICLNISMIPWLYKRKLQKLVRSFNRERMVWQYASKIDLLLIRKDRLVEATYLVSTVL